MEQEPQGEGGRWEWEKVSVSVHCVCELHYLGSSLARIWSGNETRYFDRNRQRMFQALAKGVHKLIFNSDEAEMQ